ncbi:MAG TPA: hypothetical protein VMU78_03975, partial [Methylocella sp.]|nr:hypothetical protein [Methylocella sp.]
MQIKIEVIVALGFFSVALGGAPWMVPAADVMHGIWDYAHHHGSRLTPIPLWYPPFCAVYDWVVAVADRVGIGGLRG